MVMEDDLGSNMFYILSHSNIIFTFFLTIFSDTNVKLHSVMYQKKFLASLLSKLDDATTAQQIVAELNKLRDILISTTNLGVHVTADFTALNSKNTDLNSVWQRFGFGGAHKKYY